MSDKIMIAVHLILTAPDLSCPVTLTVLPTMRL